MITLTRQNFDATYTITHYGCELRLFVCKKNKNTYNIKIMDLRFFYFIKQTGAQSQDMFYSIYTCVLKFMYW